MTAATVTRSATRAKPGYGFRSVARMEWLKLRSVRSTAWVALVFAAGLIGLAPLGTSIQNSVGQFMPMIIAENSLTPVKPVAHSLSPGVGLAMLCLYAAAALAAGTWALACRDA